MGPLTTAFAFSALAKSTNAFTPPSATTHSTLRSQQLTPLNPSTTLNTFQPNALNQQRHLTMRATPFDHLFEALFKEKSSDTNSENNNDATLTDGASALDANDSQDLNTSDLSSEQASTNEAGEAGNGKVPPRDPAINQQAKQIISGLNLAKRTLPDALLNRLISMLKENIDKNSTEGSLTATLLSTIIDMAADSNDPEGQEEFLYLLLKAASILDETAQTADETNKTPVPLLQSLALDGLDSVLTSPKKFDPFGILNLYQKMFETLAGNKKDQAYDVIAHLKNNLLSSLGKEDVNSLATKIKLVIFLFLTVDTGLDVPTEELVESFNKLGIIFSKVAQTVGGQANNAFFKDGGPKERLIEACKTLQQYNKPMTEQEAKAQLAPHFEKELGPDWLEKKFKKIDLSKPLKTGTIAGVYKAITADDREVIVKIKKPIEEQLAMEKVQVGQVLNALYRIVQEAVNTFERLDRPVPDILDKANLFQRSESSTKSFFDRFEAELNLENEALTMQQTSCLTPEVIESGPSFIMMDFIEDGITPFDYIEISDRAEPVNYKKASDPVAAVKGWIQTHHPFEINEIKSNRNGGKNESVVHVTFNDPSVKPIDFTVKQQSGSVSVKPNRSYIDFSPKAREMIATQNIVDLILQLSDGLLNCDAHSGNFLIAPGSKPGENNVYNIDFGFTATIDQKESKLAYNFIKGLLFKSEDSIAKSYLDMTEKGRNASPNEYADAVVKFSKVLKECQYTKMLSEDPDQAMGPVMEWLAEEDFNIDPKFYAIIRSFAGVASNAATMQNGKPITPKQISFLSTELLKNQLHLN